MEFKVRELEFGDIFIASKICKKINIKSLIKDAGIVDVTGKNKTQKEEITKEKGLEFFIDIFSNSENAETEILHLMAKWANLTSGDVASFKLKDLTEFYKQFTEVNSIEDITNFFKRAAGVK